MKRVPEEPTEAATSKTADNAKPIKVTHLLKDYYGDEPQGPGAPGGSHWAEWRSGTNGMSMPVVR